MNKLMLNNVAFSIFGWDIYWYAIIITSGIVIAFVLAMRFTKYRDVKKEKVVDVALLALPLAIIGARLYYVAFDSRAWTFAEIFSRSGGLAIYGGVIGGIIGGAVICYFEKTNMLKMIDIVAPVLLLAQGIGRWGNFVNQEAYGNLVANAKWQWFPYAVFIDDMGAWYQATFFYESLWNVIGAVLLYFALKKIKTDGVVGFSYLVFYGLGRTFIEGLRSDSLYIGGSGIRVSQLLSIIMVLAGAGAIAYLVYRDKKKKAAAGTASVAADGKSTADGADRDAKKPERPPDA